MERPPGLAILSPNEQVPAEWFRRPLLPKRMRPTGGPFRARFVTWRTYTEASGPRLKSRPVAAGRRNVVVCAYRRVHGRALLHLIRADVHGLHKSPLEPARRAIGFEPVLLRADSGDGVSHRTEWPVARSARFLVIDPKVRIVGEEIEFVAEAFDHRATHVAGIRQGVVVKGFVEHRERPVLRPERR